VGKSLVLGARVLPAKQSKKGFSDCPEEDEHDLKEHDETNQGQAIAQPLQ
jgi:hypothetical protein